jgi:hypothetical protein
MDADGPSSGEAVTGGTAELSVQITDDYDDATATKQFCGKYVWRMGLDASPAS